MTKWALFQLGGGSPLLSIDSMRAMQTPTIDATGMNPLLLAGLEWLGPPSYGHGWFIGEARGHKAVHHMGFIDGFSSLMVLFPELALGFVVLTNENLSAFPGTLVEHLFARIIGHSVTPAPAAPPPTPGPELPAPVPAPVLAEGTYAHPAYGPLDVVRAASDALHLEYRGHVWPLRFHTPNDATFVITAFGLEVPLPATVTNGSIAIPLSLDPRVPPQVFTRCPWPA